MRHPHVKAVLCGDTNMLRCFDGTGIPTVLVAFGRGNVALYTRKTRDKFVVASPSADPKGCLNGLMRLGRTFIEKPVLYYGDDAMLLLVSRHRGELAQHYRFLMPEPQCIEALASKLQFARLARELDLPVPRTLLAEEIQHPRQIEERLSLPCILKPNSHVGWFSSDVIMAEGGRPQKVLRASTRAEFTRLYDRMTDYTRDFLVQEYVPGDDTCIYSFHAYFNARSEPVAHCVGRKIRTYPKHSGVSTYLRLVDEPRVVQLGLEVLRKLRFTGVVKLDFKHDPVRDRFYLLEANPRFCLWNYLGAACGINLPTIAYHDLLGEPVPAHGGYRTDVKWLSFGDDLRTFTRECRRDGDLTLMQYLSSLRGRKVYDVFAWEDPGPWFVGMTRSAGRLTRKLAGRAVQALRRVPAVPETAMAERPMPRQVPCEPAMAKGGSR